MEDLINRRGLNHVLELTLTPITPSSTPKQTLQRWTGFFEDYLEKKRWVEEYVLVIEPKGFRTHMQLKTIVDLGNLAKAACDVHALLGISKNLKRPPGSFATERKFQAVYKGGPQWLQDFHAELRSVSPKYGFGSHHALPIRTTKQQIISYFAKFLEYLENEKPSKIPFRFRKAVLAMKWERIP